MPYQQSRLANLPSLPIDWSPETFSSLRQLTEEVTRGASDEQLRTAFDSLSKLDQKVLTYRLGLDGQDPRFFSTMGQQVGVSKERARQVQHQSERRFQEKLRGLLFPPRPSKESTREQLRRQLADQLGISMHTAMALGRRDITTIEQLCTFSASQIANIRTLGDKRIAEIQAALAKRGLALAEEEDDMGGRKACPVSYLDPTSDFYNSILKPIKPLKYKA